MERLFKVIRQLRHPETGCKWDLEQTLHSYKKYLSEEMDELVEAIDNNDPDNICEELGDNLINLAFVIEMASEKFDISFDDVIQKVENKMIGRHPHVFGDAVAKTAEEAAKLYYAAKAKEKEQK